MNSPKFGIGDRVKTSAFIFEIDSIHRISKKGGHTDFRYSGPLLPSEKPGANRAECYDERVMAIYQEPNKRKLFAYYQVDSFDRIVFHASEIGDTLKNLVRAPEFDILYEDEWREELVCFGGMLNPRTGKTDMKELFNSRREREDGKNG